MVARDGPIEVLLDQVWQAVAGLDAGDVADYIPELAKADPATFGLGLATLEGDVYTAGTLVPFTIQSVSKPFVHALALADVGAEEVLKRVGAEPTGDPFNSISLDDVSGRAFNPMVNAGAIITATMVAGGTRDEQFDRILEGLSAFAGRDLRVDEAVFASERETGDRNRAIAYLMRSAGLLEEDVDAQVELYFRQCSVEVTARDLAVMAATLANAGVNPVTGMQVVPRRVVAPVLTVMSTCGMYDYAGEWLYRVGLPAKSGVSGGIAAALPGQLGLAAHSPRLDARGNSVRGVAACERLSDSLGLHLLRPGERARPSLKRSYRGDAASSRRARALADREVLETDGARIAVHELVGDLGFVGAESLVRAVLADTEPADWRIFDLARATRLDIAARTLLERLAEQLAAEGTVVVLVEPRTMPPRSSTQGISDAVVRFSDVDTALEWCETQLLGRLGRSEAMASGLVPLAEQDLLRSLPAGVIAQIEASTTTRVFPAGTIVFNEGDDADGLYFVSAGLVVADVRVRGLRGRRRLSSVAAGSAFGELALIDGRPRSTRIAAVEPTICHVLSPAAFTALNYSAPEAAVQLSLAIARSLSQRLRTTTAEIASLEES